MSQWLKDQRDGTLVKLAVVLVAIICVLVLAMAPA